MGSVWGDAEYEREIAQLNEAMKKLQARIETMADHHVRLLALAKRVTELSDSGAYAANLAAEARALVRLIGGAE
jgi:hypothetical protein